MLQRIISRIFRARHYWRRISFDELAELYASRLLMTFAVNVVGLFAAMYLYQLGYSLVFIALFYAAMYAMRIPLSYVSAKIIAYFGPKRGMFFAGIIRVPSLVAFALVPEFGPPMVVLFGVFQHISATLYDIAYLVGFSKVKSVESAGREIGTMQIIEKIAKVASPIIGGVIASVFNPEVTIIVAAIVFAVAAIPLFRTIEPTKTRIPLKLRGFPFRRAVRSLIAETVVGYDFVVSGMLWTLFIGVVVFAGTGQGVYAIIGGFMSLGVLVSVAAAWVFGQMVDRSRGNRLLGVGTVAKSLLHLFRPFANTPASVAGTGIVAETATSAYAMPFMRDVLDMADRLGFRIAYLMFIEIAVNIGAMLSCLVAAALIAVYGTEDGMVWAFVFAALYQLLMLIAHRQTQR